MGKLILVRHGETEMNLNKIYYGRLDPGLTARGIEQIRKTREILLELNYDVIYSSPLLRAKETADICNYLKRNINYSDNLMELDFGIFEGLTYKEICEKYPDKMEKAEKEWQTYNYETGESPLEMFTRVKEFLKKLDYSKDNLIVAHWGVLNSIMSYFYSDSLDAYWKFDFKNGGIAVLEGNFEFCYLKKFI